LEALEWQQEMLYTAMQYSAAKGMTFLGHPPNPNEAITAIKAALEAKDEPVNDELRRLHDLLGKANALARIRAAEIESMKASLYGLYELEKQRDELEQRLTKTEARLGEAVWNYGELKREQLANQQNTSGSPIFLELHCICGAEWEWRNRDWELVATPPQRKPLTDEAVQTVPNFDQLQQIVNNLERCLTRDSKHEFLRVWIRDWTEHKLSKHTPPQRTWVGLTDEEIAEALGDEIDSVYMTDFRRVEAKLKEKNT
jgi:hypothetical protein